jgi:hypothetical protein
VVVVMRGKHGLPRQELAKDGSHRPQVHRLVLIFFWGLGFWYY